MYNIPFAVVKEKGPIQFPLLSKKLTAYDIKDFMNYKAMKDVIFNHFAIYYYKIYKKSTIPSRFELLDIIIYYSKYTPFV